MCLSLDPDQAQRCANVHSFLGQWGSSLVRPSMFRQKLNLIIFRTLCSSVSVGPDVSADPDVVSGFRKLIIDASQPLTRFVYLLTLDWRFLCVTWLIWWHRWRLLRVEAHLYLVASSIDDTVTLSWHYSRNTDVPLILVCNFVPFKNQFI